MLNAPPKLDADLSALSLKVGWLVTVANLGDSRAYLDTGCESVMLTVRRREAGKQPTVCQHACKTDASCVRLAGLF